MEYFSLRLSEKSPKYAGWPVALSLWSTELLHKRAEHTSEPLLRIAHHRPAFPLDNKTAVRSADEQTWGAPGFPTSGLVNTSLLKSSAWPQVTFGCFNLGHYFLPLR